MGGYGGHGWFYIENSTICCTKCVRTVESCRPVY